MRMRIKGRVILQADCEPRVPLLREDSTCEVCVLSQSPSLGIQAHENRGAGEMNLYRQLSETGEMREGGTSITALPQCLDLHHPLPPAAPPDSDGLETIPTRRSIPNENADPSITSITTTPSPPCLSSPHMITHQVFLACCLSP